MSILIACHTNAAKQALTAGLIAGAIGATGGFVTGYVFGHRLASDCPKKSDRIATGLFFGSIGGVLGGLRLAESACIIIYQGKLAINVGCNADRIVKEATNGFFNAIASNVGCNADRIVEEATNGFFNAIARIRTLGT